MRVFAVTLFAVLSAGAVYGAGMSDAQVRHTMIAQSLAQYPGTCPCPYNVARNGTSCGRRSAYSRPGGYSPLCYEADISKEMLDEYRRSHGL